MRGIRLDWRAEGPEVALVCKRNQFPLCRAVCAQIEPFNVSQELWTLPVTVITPECAASHIHKVADATAAVTRSGLVQRG